ncbi:HTH-type transcriptional repressor YtrA [Maioricimonas rarisocia]|uniref:HTH-type transcriptional repressor YtrA n=1 Tax=Maioricimonas rarisocia TaxID=2528026 RepID=A0A517ZDT1_9PLAN|nr:GntR family transcriptional regulator [Maioricimonas rarisocia]QDU40642.1 HTH-type transcriptional repressor YtrA [Maioricimonas rarisocia]
MLFHVDTDNGIPIYEQIARQVKYAVANSALQIGEHVPSVREMATRLAVNPNTVARAYRELQAEGVLVPIRGTGLAVTPEAPKICRDDRLELIRQRLRSVLGEARRSELADDEIRQLFETELSSLSAAPATTST